MTLRTLLSLAQRWPRWWRAGFWLAVVAGVLLALWPEPDAHEPWFSQADKVQHAVAFAVLYGLGRLAGYRRAWLLVAGLLALGAGIEVAQGFTATRSADGLDWLADAAGIAVGAALWAGARSRGPTSTALEQEHGR